MFLMIPFFSILSVNLINNLAFAEDEMSISIPDNLVTMSLSQGEFGEESQRIIASTNNNAGAVQNAGNLTIGVKDGNINASSPYLISEKYAVNNSGNTTFNYYDGVLYGKTNTISGKVTEMETNATRNDTTEVIDGGTYHKTYLS